jgi:DNA-binding response OmpR family regulator
VVAEDDALLGFDLLEDGAGAAAAPAAAPEPKGTVLLVEDEESLRLVIRDLLEREGYRVAEAVDGVQALDQVDRVAPDALILDLNLPRLDGYSVLQQLRSRPQTADLLVMVLTAKGDEDNEVKVFELGADDFLQKPFRARALAARLDALLARRKPPS